LIVEINGNRKRISPHIDSLLGTAAWLCGFVARLSYSEGIKAVLTALLTLDGREAAR
jgi:hypothetical protein